MSLRGGTTKQSHNYDLEWSFNFLFAREEGKALKKELGIPEGYVSVGVAALGYKDMEGITATRKEGTVNFIIKYIFTNVVRWLTI